MRYLLPIAACFVLLSGCTEQRADCDALMAAALDYEAAADRLEQAKRLDGNFDEADREAVDEARSGAAATREVAESCDS